jgi:hypothetical protein
MFVSGHDGAALVRAGEPTAAEAIAGFALRAGPADLGKESRRLLKRNILDTLGCAIGGLDGPPPGEFTTDPTGEPAPPQPAKQTTIATMLIALRFMRYMPPPRRSPSATCKEFPRPRTRP